MRPIKDILADLERIGEARLTEFDTEVMRYELEELVEAAKERDVNFLLEIGGGSQLFVRKW